MSVIESRDGELLLLQLANPPVNGLSFALRQALFEALERADADPGIAAVLIHGGPKAFSGGADIREFGQPQALAQPNLPALCARLDGMSKPVVAAIAGLALGGGLELALSCHYRLVVADAQIGLPEVNLGLLPRRGGHPALPAGGGPGPGAWRWCPAASCAGRPSCLRGPTKPCSDQVCTADELLSAAAALARRVVALRPLPRLRDRSAAPAPDALAAARCALRRLALSGSAGLRAGAAWRGGAALR